MSGSGADHGSCGLLEQIQLGTELVVAPTWELCMILAVILCLSPPPSFEGYVRHTVSGEVAVYEKPSTIVTLIQCPTSMKEGV